MTKHELRQVLLSAKGINLTLGGNLILRDVNLEIRNIHREGHSQGQVVGLLGPSGMGKTRLFRILAGLDEPDTGEVLVGNAQVPVKRGMVGVVAQSYPLFEHRTVMGNLVLSGKLGNMSSSEARRKAMDYLKQFALEDHGKKYPVQLSGGMRQRVAIAQQFMCSEHFLLMDEPFSGLDVNAIDRVCKFIQEVAASDELKTIIVVTHDISAAVQVCDTIWLLGRDQEANGTPIPGARIQKSINLIERDLAWHDTVIHMPRFSQTVQEIRDDFSRL